MTLKSIAILVAVAAGLYVLAHYGIDLSVWIDKAKEFIAAFQGA
jgi:hydrogenase maturation factor